MLKAIGERSREIIASDNLNYLKGEDKVVYVCFLPEINGEEENFLIKTGTISLSLFYPWVTLHSQRSRKAWRY